MLAAKKQKTYIKRGNVYTELKGSRYEDGDDRRLSTGGSGGRWGQIGNSYRNTESARLGGEEGQQIRKAKLEAYINSDLEASDGTFGKIIAGSLLFTITAGLVGVYMYYGGDGLMTAARLS